MDKTECVIYKGKFFQIEWYYSEEGESQPYDYFMSCDVIQQRKFLMLCQRMGRSIPMFFQEGEETHRNKCLSEKR